MASAVGGLRTKAWEPIVQVAALVAFATLVAVYHWWPQIDSLPYTAELDGRYALQQLEIAKAAIRQYHEIALFNPYDCRGIPMWDHPESLTASPVVLLTTRLSSPETLVVWNVFHSAAGFLGMWFLARKELELDPMPSMVAACMWATSVAHTSQYAGAHSTLSPFLLAPWMLWLWRRAEADLRMAIALGAVIAFMVYEGATYPLPYCTLVVALETLTRVWPPRRLARVALAGVVTGVVGIGLSAARLFPLLVQLRSKQRPGMDLDVDKIDTLYTLDRMFLFREAKWSTRLPEQQYVFGEYIAYVGWLALGLALVGFVLSLRGRHRWFAGLAIVTLLLMLGHFAKWAPWTLLHKHAFPFKSMRVPSRFRLVFHLFLCGWVALAVQEVPRVFRSVARRQQHLSDGLRVALVAAALLAVGDAMGLGKGIIAAMHQAAGPRQVDRAPRFHYSAGLSEIIDMPRQNEAWLGCRSYEWPSHQGAPVWTGDVAQVKPLQDGTATVSAIRRTVNTFRFHVEAPGPARVLLNSAHADGFRTSVGTVVEHEELLALDLPPGRHDVVVRYWPKGMTIGIWLSVATALAVLAGFAVGGLRRWRQTRRAPSATVGDAADRSRT